MYTFLQTYTRSDFCSLPLIDWYLVLKSLLTLAPPPDYLLAGCKAGAAVLRFTLEHCQWVSAELSCRILARGHGLSGRKGGGPCEMAFGGNPG